MSTSSANSKTLLDEALSPLFPRAVVVVEDCVGTSGASVLHHLMKHSLSSSGGALVFVSLSHPFSHYDRILRKLGCNLVTQKDNNRLFFFDVLKLECTGGDGRNIGEDRLVDLFGKIQKAVEVSASQEYNRGSITIMIEDVSLLEGCSLVMLNHEDIYSSMVAPRLISLMEYLADIIIKAEPLATGLATDVHGQLTVVDKGVLNEHYLGNRIRNFHFRVKETGVEYFYPGTRT